MWISYETHHELLFYDTNLHSTKPIPFRKFSRFLFIPNFPVKNLHESFCNFFLCNSKSVHVSIWRCCITILVNIIILSWSLSLCLPGPQRKGNSWWSCRPTVNPCVSFLLGIMGVIFLVTRHLTISRHATNFHCRSG